MSLSIHIIASVPTLDVVRRLEAEFGSEKFGPLKAVRLGWSGEWEHGRILVQSLAANARDEIGRESGIPDPQTLIWLTCDVRDAGFDAACQLTAGILQKWKEDIALMPNGDEPALTRVGGKLTLFNERLSQEQAAYFE